MITTRRFFAALSALTIASSTVYIACDGDSNAVKEPPVGSDSGPTGSDSGPIPGTDGGADSGGDGGPTDCVVNPKTHAEIINACTNAVKLTKNPVLPKLLPDGGLPPL